MFRLIAAIAALALTSLPSSAAAKPVAIRVAVFNLWDVRSEDVRNPDHPRTRALAEVIQRVQPNIIVLNEIAYDMPGVLGVPEDARSGENARIFAENFLAIAQADGLSPLAYTAYMPDTNTGKPSGFDLDRSGQVVTELGPIPASQADKPGEQTEQGRAFGGDCWGFGTFPGQYAMALLVDTRLGFNPERVRTFRLFPWSAMPNARMPRASDGSPWYSGEAGEAFRLSSKNHVDAPITLPNGAELRVLFAHPTPPGFDGPENRNGLRNHDEIRFLADYIEGATYISDDAGRIGPMPRGSHFVIMGDLNADPEDPQNGLNPIGDLLYRSPRVGPQPTPLADLSIDGLGPSDTAVWGKRVDHIISGASLTVLRSGVWRSPPALWQGRESSFPSDHFLVWADVVVPGPESDAPRTAKP